MGELDNYSREERAVDKLKIYSIRDRSVVLDSDLASVYGVETRVSIKLSGEIERDSLQISRFSSQKKNGKIKDRSVLTHRLYGAHPDGSSSSS